MYLKGIFFDLITLIRLNIAVPDTAALVNIRRFSWFMFTRSFVRITLTKACLNFLRIFSNGCCSGNLELLVWRVTLPLGASFLLCVCNQSECLCTCVRGILWLMMTDERRGITYQWHMKLNPYVNTFWSPAFSVLMQWIHKWRFGAVLFNNDATHHVIRHAVKLNQLPTYWR